MYAWRKMTPKMCEEVLAMRKLHGQPWHGPPHGLEKHWHHISAACYNHQTILGQSPQRMAAFEKELLGVLSPVSEGISAWCILPNHYHVLLQCINVTAVRQALGRMHGRLSHAWNQEDKTAGRTCWHRCLIKPIKNDSHRWATLNYIHHNAVHHAYVEQWQEWPFSSAAVYLGSVGRTFAESMWKQHPILEIGKGWDEQDL
jgi:putative transposase